MFAVRSVGSRAGVRSVARGTSLASGRRQFSQRAAAQEKIYPLLLNTNAKYLTFVITGAAIGEMMFGGFTNQLWKFNNRGKLYEDIDWSKWESNYLGDDDEEEEEEEEDEE